MGYKYKEAETVKEYSKEIKGQTWSNQSSEGYFKPQSGSNIVWQAQGSEKLILKQLWK